MKSIVIFSLFLCVAAGPETRPATTQAAAPARIIYLIDGTGSMMYAFDSVRKQVGADVEKLPMSTGFNIVVFSGDQVRGLSSSIEQATDERKAKAKRFLEDSTPSGSEDEAAAFNAAFDQRPREIWFYSDGDLSDWPKIAALVERRAKLQQVKVNTVLGYAQKQFENPLILLARKTGGVCVDEKGKPVPEDRKGDLPRTPEAKPKRKAAPDPPKREPDRGVKLK